MIPSCDCKSVSDCKWNRERKGHINLKTSSGGRPGVPGTPGETNRGLPASVVGDLLMIALEKLTDLPGYRPGVPGTPGCPAGFRKLYVICSYDIVPFLLSSEHLCFGSPCRNCLRLLVNFSFACFDG